jgi:hypothetical protein
MADDVKSGTVVSQRSTVQEAFYRKLGLEAEIDDENGGSDVSSRIQEKILNATTEEEIFAASQGGTVAGKDFLNRPFRLREEGVRVMESTIEPSKDNPNPEPFYLLMDVVDLADGEEVTLNCGGKGIVATVISLRDNGILAKYEGQGGMPLMLTAKSTRKGNDVLNIQPFKAAMNVKASK